MMQDYPFRHLILDGIIHDNFIDGAAAEFPSAEHPGWRWFRNQHELKAAGDPRVMGGENCRYIVERLRSREWVDWLGQQFGIEGLLPSEEGGGLHLIPPGGFLGIHADFNRSSDGLYRRINCLLYLNRGWWPEWGGALELWDRYGPSVTVEPQAGRMVLFETSSSSFHGHPLPTTGPASRRSIAVYYFSKEPPENVQEPHSTLFWNP